MPRIRTIKPEFWSSPGIENISPWARLLFIAMWNWADDAGRGTCQLRELQAFAFPYDEDAPEVATPAGFRRTLAEVRDQYGVLFYKVGGRPFYAIPSWRRHQRNERSAKSRYPAPEEGQEWDFLPPDQASGGTSDNFRPGAAEAEKGAAENGGSPDGGADASGEPRPPSEGAASPEQATQQALDLGSGGTSDDLRHGAAEAPQTSGPGTGEQGNRGTGDSAPTERGAAAPAQRNAATLLAEWLESRPKRPPQRVINHVAGELKKLLDEGIDYDDVRAGFIAWSHKGKHPSTLPSFVNEAMTAEVIPIGAARPSTADQRAADALNLAAKYAAQEAAEGGPQ